jgi:threonine dehydrogenase-like Zn-dependent dehydrogenase
VPDPQILNSRDAIIRVTSSAICGSDLHLYNGFNPAMEKGDILGHEFMGEVVEVGPAVRNLRVGERIVVPFPIACGECAMCRRDLFSCCENSNPNAWMAEKVWGGHVSGIYGYSHLAGGYAGGQAEYVRVPFADVDHLKVPDGIPDEQVLFLGDVLPTGFMGADICDIVPGDVVAVWGAGPVGQFAIASAYMLGADRVIAIDRFDYRLNMARQFARAWETVNYEQTDTYETVKELTGGRGPDKCIDAVGMEAHSHGPQYAYDRTKQALRIELDRPIALREAIRCCRNGGTIAVMGGYYGFVDKFPIGSIMNRSLSIKSGQCHVQHYMQPLLQRILAGEIDPSWVITHRMGLEDAPRGYEMFTDKIDNCEKVVLKN